MLVRDRDLVTSEECSIQEGEEERKQGQHGNLKALIGTECFGKGYGGMTEQPIPRPGQRASFPGVERLERSGPQDHATPPL